MISFILNDKLIRTDSPAGMTLLDFIRYNESLKGTKIGCREGDCGACTVLEGHIVNNVVKYKTIVSCLTPLGNIHGKHIVTIEGLNLEKLSPVQHALVEHNGTQCGFCTPGFTVSFTAFLLSEYDSNIENAIAAVDGNICRCTGYKSIERAANELIDLKEKIDKTEPVKWLVSKKYLPEYFNSIGKRLKGIQNVIEPNKNAKIIVGGGTDMYVQKPDELMEQDLVFIPRNSESGKIIVTNKRCSISGEATTNDIMESKELQKHFPQLRKHFKLISSTPIRNMGTLAGNIVNASPIGDLSIFFLALDADLILSNRDKKERKLKLKDFFIGYKKLDIMDDDLIEAIEFLFPVKSDHFNFEKVSKRQFLDIASVNSAIKLTIENGKIKEAHLSAGGVSPVPLYLKKTSAFLVDKEINAETIINANTIAQEEISPISDIRGSADYKRLLLRQLIFAHFIELSSGEISVSKLLQTKL